MIGIVTRMHQSGMRVSERRERRLSELLLCVALPRYAHAPPPLLTIVIELSGVAVIGQRRLAVVGQRRVAAVGERRMAAVGELTRLLCVHVRRCAARLLIR